MKLLAKLFDLLASKGQNLGQQISNAYSGWKEKRKPDTPVDEEPNDFTLTDEQYVKQLGDNTSQFYQQANEDLALERQETENEIEQFTIKFSNLTEQAHPQSVSNAQSQDNSSYQPQTTFQTQVTIDSYKTDFAEHQNQLNALMDASTNQATNQHEQLERNIYEMTDEFERYS